MRNPDIETPLKRIPIWGVKSVDVKFVVDYPTIFFIQMSVQNMLEVKCEEAAREIRDKWGEEVVEEIF